ncbi:unnamed protein product [Brassicogethes aeneus]|uniref:DUF4817 domain-containing protein n=1 Tax=Brassicogethes aeneus TaxID=1431903 RepID=A0A9P0AYS1_BRAAE|nr:unnamed protein product [Brassicogethes aeneus]
MEYLAVQEKIEIVLIYGEAARNVDVAVGLYAERFPDGPRSRATIYRVVKQFTTEGSEENNQNAVLASVAYNPHVSTRAISRDSGIALTSVWRILKRQKFHPYHISLHQELHGDDFNNRVAFCNWAQAQLQQDPEFFSRVLFSEESTFTNHCEVNRHNMHYWSVENPRWLRQNVPLARLQNMWYQHDGCPAHYSAIAREVLDREFNGRWIDRRGSVSRPARSPDLTTPDFFLWGYLKEKVYAAIPTTREDMVERIRNACAAIPPDMLARCVPEFNTRIQKWGYVLVGGAICMELLTKQGWSSAYTVEAVIMQISATLVKGKARIQFGAVKVCSQGQYSLARAQQSFKSLVQIHEKNGYIMPRNIKDKYDNNGSTRRTHSYMSAEDQASGKKSYWTELEITGTIRNLSPNLFQMTQLTALYLKNNCLHRLPPDICQLVNLRNLDLSYNKLRSLPAELGELIHLRELQLCHNFLRILPYELGKLFNLMVLGLAGNPLNKDIMNIYSEPNGTQRLLTYMLDNLQAVKPLVIKAVLYNHEAYATSVTTTCVPACIRLGTYTQLYLHYTLRTKTNNNLWRFTNIAFKRFNPSDHICAHGKNIRVSTTKIVVLVAYNSGV